MSVNATGVAATGSIGSVVLLGINRRAKDVDLWAQLQVEQLLVRQELQVVFVSTPRVEVYVQAELES